MRDQARLRSRRSHHLAGVSTRTRPGHRGLRHAGRAGAGDGDVFTGGVRRRGKRRCDTVGLVPALGYGGRLEIGRDYRKEFTVVVAGGGDEDGSLGGVPRVGLTGGEVGLLPLGEEGGDRDGGEDADDDDHDQELDEGEASLIPLYLVKLLEPLSAYPI